MHQIIVFALGSKQKQRIIPRSGRLSDRNKKLKKPRTNKYVTKNESHRVKKHYRESTDACSRPGKIASVNRCFPKQIQLSFPRNLRTIERARAPRKIALVREIPDTFRVFKRIVGFSPAK